MTQGHHASSPYLLVEEVAQRLRCSTRRVRELCRLHEIPHRKLPGSRRLLFLAQELELWENGMELEAIELPRGGRVVRPIAATERAQKRINDDLTWKRTV